MALFYISKMSSPIESECDQLLSAQQFSSTHQPTESSTSQSDESPLLSSSSHNMHIHTSSVSESVENSLSLVETSSYQPSSCVKSASSSLPVSKNDFGLGMTDRIINHRKDSEPNLNQINFKFAHIENKTNNLGLISAKLLEVKNQRTLTKNVINQNGLASMIPSTMVVNKVNNNQDLSRNLTSNTQPIRQYRKRYMPVKKLKVCSVDYEISKKEEIIIEDKNFFPEDQRMCNQIELSEISNNNKDYKDIGSLTCIDDTIISDKLKVGNVLDLKKIPHNSINVDSTQTSFDDIKGYSDHSLSSSSCMKSGSISPQEMLSLIKEREKDKLSSILANPPNLPLGLISLVINKTYPDHDKLPMQIYKKQDSINFNHMPVHCENLDNTGNFLRNMEEKITDFIYEKDTLNSEEYSNSSCELPANMVFGIDNVDNLPGLTHSCEICSASFSSKRNLRLHMCIHSGKNLYTCCECSETFSFYSLYYDHKLKHKGVNFKLFECPICEMTFNREEDLESHREIHRELNMFECSSCTQSFATKDRLSKHVKTHIAEVSYFCEKCGKLFKKRLEFEKHKNEDHLISGSWICEECGEIYHTSDTLEKHILSIHNEEINLALSQRIRLSGKMDAENLKCEICSENFANLTEYFTHRDTHSNDSLYKCSRCKSNPNYDKCDSCFKSSILDRINQNSTNNPKLKCPHCDSLFETSNELLSHSIMHNREKPYHCNECKAAFKHSSTLEIHKRVHYGENSFLCPQCGATFIQKEHLNIHLRSHSNDKPYKCIECDASFTKKDYLVAHASKHSSLIMVKNCSNSHQDDGNLDLLQCKYCDMSFIHQSSLVTHIRKHTGERPFVCEVCGVSFLYSSNLTTHRRKHSGERPYTCKECDASFTLKSYLTMHLRKHSGERPFKCDVCASSFTQKTHLSTHRRIHTGEYPYKCEVCGDAFRDGANFWRHKKRHEIEASGKNQINSSKINKKMGSKSSKKRVSKKFVPSTPGSISLEAGNSLLNGQGNFGEKPSLNSIPISINKLSNIVIEEESPYISEHIYANESQENISVADESFSPLNSIMKSDISLDYSIVS